MELKLTKQPLKYLASVDAQTRNKLYKALDKLKELEGILCSIDRNGQIIIVETINTRTNIKY